MTIDHKYGVPTVAFHTQPFERVVRSVTQLNGMPRMRQVFVPQPVMGKTSQQLRAYIDGTDPVTGRPVMQEVIEGLTMPLDDEDLKQLTFERSTPRLVEPDTEENLHRLFQDNHWTDYLPIILPTEERVAAMLAHTSAKPEYFPVILALAATGASARGSTTSSAAAMVVVNGPVRHELGMNAGIGAMGPYNHANATIGRAYGLLSQNLQGGSVPGLTYMGSQGNGYMYNSLTFAENEERSPWEPFHVQHGFQPTESTVSVFFGGWYTQAGFGPRETWQEKFKHCFAAAEHNFPPLLVLDPIVARG